jgi:SAM-dependent methyltransferase
LNISPSYDDKKICLACQADFIYGHLNTYSICPTCGTANLISLKSAEEDNRNYFDNHRSSPNIPLRATLFSVFNKLDQFIHFNEFIAYERLLGIIEKKIQESEISVEIGFGGGDELVSRLGKGANCYGIDLSSSVVDSFKARYPNYSNRVTCEAAGKSSIACNLIYSNALFEHLDMPDKFLKSAYDQLKDGGLLALRIPIKIDDEITKEEVDINFWKPCHRALYSLKGIEVILKRNGFQILHQATLPYYGYKVMNRLLKNGYSSIHEIRSPYTQVPNLNLAVFTKALMGGLFERLVCAEYAAIAIKIENN